MARTLYLWVSCSIWHKVYGLAQDTGSSSLGDCGLWGGASMNQAFPAHSTEAWWVRACRPGWFLGLFVVFWDDSEQLLWRGRVQRPAIGRALLSGSVTATVGLSPICKQCMVHVKDDPRGHSDWRFAARWSTISFRLFTSMKPLMVA